MVISGYGYDLIKNRFMGNLEIARHMPTDNFSLRYNRLTSVTLHVCIFHLCKILHFP